MKKLFFTIFLTSISLQAQVGVGTSAPHASAALDVTSSNKGFLLPRVDLTGVTDNVTIPSPANGLFVYNKTASGTGNTLVRANRAHFWRINTWEQFTNLAEIHNLKVPIHFAWLSNEEHILTAAQRSTINTTSADIVPLNWVNPGDVIVANPDNIETQADGISLKILTTSFYLTSGTLTYQAITGTTTDVTNIVCTMQKSTDNGSTWADTIGTVLPFEAGAGNHPQSIVFPSNVRQFNAGDLIRFVISRPNSGENNLTPSNHLDGSGARSRLTTDVTQSFKITRIIQ